MTAPQMTFWDHFGELRRRMVIGAAAVVVGSVIAFLFREQILDFLVDPLCRVRDDPECGVVILRPTEGFSVVMRLALAGGVVIASPVLIYQLWRFVSPVRAS